nr:hypothetical protein [Sandarakinorhabdus sp.]
MLDLLFEQLDLRVQMRTIAVCGSHARLPKIAKQFDRQRVHRSRWAHVAQDGFKLAFHLVTPDRLAVGLATFCLAEIIWVLPAATCRPATTKRLAAIVALNCTTKHEIKRKVFARRTFGLAVQAILHGAERRQTHNRLMLCRPHVNVPVGVIQIARIVNPVQDFEDTLDGQFFATCVRPCGMRIDVAHYLCRPFEPTGLEAFENFLDE